VSSFCKVLSSNGKNENCKIFINFQFSEPLAKTPHGSVEIITVLPTSKAGGTRSLMFLAVRSTGASVERTARNAKIGGDTGRSFCRQDSNDPHTAVWGFPFCKRLSKI
jgi:hypothetical protein